jgi:type II secretory pathway component GspD/PulD (secretin)
MRLYIRICLIIFAVLFWSNGGVVFSQEQKPPAKQTQETQTQATKTQETQKGAGQASSQAPQAERQAESAAPSVPPIIQIKPLEGKENIYSFELRNVEIGDLFRVLAHDYKLNLLVDKDIQGQVTASLSNVTLEEALSAIAESQNLILEKKGNIIKVSPNLVTKTFTLKFVEAKRLLETSTEKSKGATGETANLATIYDLLSNKGKILLGNQPNSIMVIDYPGNINKVEEFLKAVDQKRSSRVFKLKYLKASEIVGATTVSTTSTQTTATTGGTTTSTTTTAAEPKH